jgi:Asp-tRNA(Asn)/Glu-tRNA(Gln) amidotransferase C subunit
MKINNYFDFINLEIVHIFDFYDFPLFFISKSPNDEYFLNYYVEELENDMDKWLFSRISNNERINLIHKRASTLELLKRLYDKGRLNNLVLNKNRTDNSYFKISQINEENFDPESFPADDFFVEYDYLTKTDLVEVKEDFIDSSKFKMVLNDKVNSHDIDFDLLLSVMSNFKKSLSQIANDVGKKLFGRVTDLNPINLRVDAFQPSSFGILLKTEKKDGDLFELPERSLDSFFQLIDDISSKSVEYIEEQIELDENYTLETIKQMKHLLKEVSDNNFSFKLEGVTKYGNQLKNVKFDKESYYKLDILNEILKKNSQEVTEKIEVEGILTSVNLPRNRFRISTTTMGEIQGSMSKELIKKLRNETDLQFKVPSIIKAKIEKTIVNDLLDDNYVEKNTLVYFEQ